VEFGKQRNSQNRGVDTTGSEMNLADKFVDVGPSPEGCRHSERGTQARTVVVFGILKAAQLVEDGEVVRGIVLFGPELMIVEKPILDVMRKLQVEEGSIAAQFGRGLDVLEEVWKHWVVMMEKLVSIEE